MLVEEGQGGEEISQPKVQKDDQDMEPPPSSDRQGIVPATEDKM